jgi:hypothetical protein
MAKFHTFAEPVTPDSVSWVAHVAGVTKNPPGVTIKSILEHTGGVYEHKLEMRDNYREKVRAVARLTGDEELMKIADHTEVAISLEHLRDIDPETRIEVGYWLEYTPEERERLGIVEGRPFDPKKSVDVKVDPAKPWRIARS